MSTDPKEQRRNEMALTGADWLWLSSILPMEMAQNGDELRGISFCPRQTGWLMTVRVTLDGAQSVAFTMTGTPIACVASFRKRWENETLQFFPDRYA